jgi:hypothetical protein
MAYLRKIPLAIILVFLFLPALIAHADPLIPLVGGCQIFPTTNPWNIDISGAAVDGNSGNYITNINANGGTKVHPDFGSSNPTYGIPYVTVSSTQPKVPVSFHYDDESDAGMYPIPPTAPIEGGAASDGDRHVLVIDTTDCMLYELYSSTYLGGSQHAWHAESGAIFDLRSNALRTDGFTSADAAGLPILPGLARCDEANTGTISHALRFTVEETKEAHIYPATHHTFGNTGNFYPPMGLRLRLKSSYLTTHTLTGQSLAIATALTKYGMILADNGSNWYISGEADYDNPGCWDDNNLVNQLGNIPGNQFEVIVPPVPATVLQLAPSIHTPKDGEATTAAHPVLDWNVVTGATEYEVQFGTSVASMTTVATVFATSYTQYTVPDALTSGFTYYWRVRAFNGATAMPYSTPQGFVAASLPAAASNRNIYTTHTPTLTWTPITTATGYVVEISHSTTFSSPITSPTLAANISSWLVTSSLADGTYYWHVRPSTSTAWSPTESFIVHLP